MVDNSKNELLVSASFKIFLENTTDMVFIKDNNYVYRVASQSFANYTVFSSPDILIGKTDFDIFENQELARRYRADDERIFASDSSLLEYVEPMPGPDGASRYCATSKFIIRDAQGNQLGLMGVSHDITREYEAKLNYERELSYLFELPEDAIFAVLFDVTGWRVIDFRTRDEHNHIISRYDTIESFMRCACESVVDDPEASCFFTAFSKETIQTIFEEGKRRLSLKYRRKFPNGTILWVHEEIYFLNDPISGHLSVFFILKDINSDKEKLDALYIAAQHDSLTGLLNHNAVMSKISEEIVHHKLGKYSALFMIDIDNFKVINDTLGHKKGDQILKEIAVTLQNTFRDSDVLGRIGGDEFFAYMKNAVTLDMITKKALHLVNSLQKAYTHNGAEIDLSCSVGISILNDTAKPLDLLYDEADKALYQAKRDGKNQFCLYKE